MPFFAGVMTGETRALVESFAGAPELRHRVRGRVKGVAAFERFVSELRVWLAEHTAAAEDVDFVLTPGCGVEELILYLDTDNGRSELPVAIASDHDERGRIVEQRIHFSSWPLTGGHAIRPPVLQPRLGPRAGRPRLHAPRRGRASRALRAVRAWGRTTLPPQAGLAVYVRGDSGRLAAARIYDDADPPLTR